ncbi:hypothetical protein L2E82_03430 [Cichorium intybus]|uniref:Uncharacterized protein n=1 Tax=Cichorium intybus TaxID=13427 RepID=A0ACB9H3Z9_CICIN|nr:hypothetical protein L2E82_03430 [Cichorium intybus]
MVEDDKTERDRGIAEYMEEKAGMERKAERKSLTVKFKNLLGKSHGCFLLEPYPAPGFSVWRFDCKVIWLQQSPSFCLHLIERDSNTKLPEGPWSANGAVADPKNLPRGHHLCFSVSDFDSFVKTLKVPSPFFLLCTFGKRSCASLFSLTAYAPSMSDYQKLQRIWQRFRRWSGILKVPLFPVSRGHYKVAASLFIATFFQNPIVPSMNAIFFNGDRVRGTGNTVIERLSDIEKIGEIIVSKLGQNVNVWVIEASKFNGSFAVYKDFIPSVNKWGEPTSYDPTGFPASTSIVSLLSTSLTQERTETRSPLIKQIEGITANQV